MTGSAAGMRGIIPAVDADYDSVRRLAETLGLDALPGGEE